MTCTLCNSATYPFQGPPRCHPQESDSILNSPLVQFALELRLDAWLLPVPDVRQGAAALPGGDHKCVHRLHTHTHADRVAVSDSGVYPDITSCWTKHSPHQRPQESEKDTAASPQRVLDMWHLIQVVDHSTTKQ